MGGWTDRQWAVGQTDRQLDIQVNGWADGQIDK